MKSLTMYTDMTKGKPSGLILRFTVPLFLGNSFQQLYNMADSMIVGKFVGAGALAAVGSTGTIMFLVLGIAIGLTTGFSVMTSQYYGAKDYQLVKYSFTGGIIMSGIFGIIITVASLSIMPFLLRVMNTPDDIFADALTYINIICAGTLATLFYNLMAAFLRAIGNSRVPLYFLIFSACLNVVLDIVFIIGLKAGVAGAAIATVTSQGISAILCVIYIYKKVTILRPARNDWKLYKPCCKRQIDIGIPMALETGITASGTLIMQAALNIYGTLSIAGSTAAYRIINFMSQGLYSLGQTMASYAGQNYGAGAYDRIAEGTRSAMKINAVYSIITGILGAIFLSIFMRLFFSADVSMSEVMPWARIAHDECAVMYIALGAIFVYRNTLQGCGYSLQAMTMGIVELTARIIMAVISIHVYSYPLAIGADPAAWLTAGTFGWILYRILIYHKVKEGL